MALTYPGQPVMPCGFHRTGKLAEHLRHYRACSHPACAERLAAWEDLKRTVARNGGVQLTTKEGKR